MSAHSCSPSRARISRAEIRTWDASCSTAPVRMYPAPSSDATLCGEGCDPAVPPDRRSGDYPESRGRHPTKLRDHLLCESPAEIRLCRISVQVVERQNGDERRVARRAQGEPRRQSAAPENRRAGHEAVQPRDAGSGRGEHRLRRDGFGRNRAAFLTLTSGRNRYPRPTTV